MAGQARGSDGSEAAVRRLCFYNFLDIAAALGVALVINVAVLLVSAATFHSAGERGAWPAAVAHACARARRCLHSFGCLQRQRR